MNKYCVAADFKKETIHAYAHLNKLYPDSAVTETYGQITHDHFFESGRVLKDLPNMRLQELQNYIAYSSRYQIGFNYSLNGSCMGNRDITALGMDELAVFLKCLEQAGVTSITVAIPTLIEFIQHCAPSMEIKLSIINQVNTVNKIKEYEKMGIKRIVIDESCNRDFDKLRRFQEAFSGSIELIANSLCHKDCIYRAFHYNQTAHDSVPASEKTVSSFYNHRCMIKRASAAEEILKLCWIRPEDLSFYEKIGIHQFKLQGRHTVYAGNPAKAVEAYFSKSYTGNLLDLLEMFNSPYRFKVNLQNDRLDGFISHFTKGDGCRSDCRKCGYCADFLNSRFDRSEFDVINGHANKFYKEIDEFSQLVVRADNKSEALRNDTFQWEQN